MPWRRPRARHPGRRRESWVSAKRAHTWVSFAIEMLMEAAEDGDALANQGRHDPGRAGAVRRRDALEFQHRYPQHGRKCVAAINAVGGTMITTKDRAGLLLGELYT
jgi:hypothetical protein